MARAVNFEAGYLQVIILLNRLSLGWYVMNAGWEKVQRELVS